MKKLFHFLHFANKGFSLIETAISLLIFTTLSVSLMSLFKISCKTQEIKTIKSHEEIVCNSLKLFYESHRRLPAPSQNDSGYEIDANNSTEIIVGYIPYKTLGILHDEACDNRGQLLTYAVNKYDCIEFNDKSGVDAESLKKIFSKTKLILDSNGKTEEIYFALTTNKNKIHQNNGNVTVAKNALTISMSQNAFLGMIK